VKFFMIMAGAFLTFALQNVRAADGVDSTVIVRPRQAAASVVNCAMGQQGTYRMRVGDILELDYSYPVTPGTMPRTVSYVSTGMGAVNKSVLGFRPMVVPRVVGGSTIGFFFDAVQPGVDTVSVIIDGARYTYTVEVADR
jgi:hypothetical protein